MCHREDVHYEGSQPQKGKCDLETQLTEVKSELAEVKSELAEVKSELAEVKSELESKLVEVSRSLEEKLDAVLTRLVVQPYGAKTLPNCALRVKSTKLGIMIVLDGLIIFSYGPHPNTQGGRGLAVLFESLSIW